LTCNYAEYSALIIGLKQAEKLKIENLTVYGDSLLVIEQLNGNYKIKSENLKPLYKQATHLISNFPVVKIIHIPRKLNGRADELSNQAIDNNNNNNNNNNNVSKF